ncbi:MAG: hypothetical protein PHX61_15020 [Alphaproteobacteria bacterium]|nr:hypothetical protein [Alphaproteobacteria bacterium]
MSYIMVDSSALADFLTIIKGYISMTVTQILPVFAIIVGISVAVYVVKMFLN